MNIDKIKEFIKNTALKFSASIAAFALSVLIFDVNSTCTIVIHQPKLPEGSEKFLKL